MLGQYFLFSNDFAQSVRDKTLFERMGSMTMYGKKVCIFAICEFVFISFVQRFCVRNQALPPEFAESFQYASSLSCAMFISILAMNLAVYAFSSTASCFVCALSSSTVLLISATTHFLNSLDGSRMGIAQATDYHPIVHSLWAEWLVCVPLLVFVIGHVTQIRPKFVFAAMAIQLLVILLGYIADVASAPSQKLLLFSLSAAFHIILVTFVLLICSAVAFEYELARQYSRNEGMKTYRNICIALALSVVVVWSIFPILFLLNVVGFLSEKQYLFSSPFTDVFAKGVFTGVISGVYWKQEVTKQTVDHANFSFLRFLNHHLKNPLNSLLLGLGHLECEGKLPEYQPLIKSLQSSATDINQSIEDVLQLTLDHKNVQVVKAPVNLRELMAASISEYEHQAQTKSIIFETQISETLPNEVMADKPKIILLFGALISNAVKFSPPQTVVNINLVSEKNVGAKKCKVVFTVQDAGPGIPIGMSSLIFDPFSILHSADSNLQSQEIIPAPGLRLCYAKRLADKMGADLTFTTNTPRGTVFKLTFQFDVCRMQTAPTCPGFTDDELPIGLLPASHEFSIQRSKHSSKVVPDGCRHQQFVNIAHVDALTGSWGQMNKNTRGRENSMCLSNNKTLAYNWTHKKSHSAGSAGIISAHTNLLGLRKCEELKWNADAKEEATQTNLLGLRKFEELKWNADTKEEDKDSLEQGCTKTDESVPVTKTGENAVPIDVLVVDDMNTNAQLASMIIKKAGYECDIARDGLEAVQMAYKNRYKLILMDRIMPVMDGIAATRQILCFDAKVSIVGLTANVSQQEQTEFLEAGAKQVLVKPTNKVQLQKVCEKYCNGD